MADRITYQNFDLKISGAGDQYTAAVLRSPGGEGQITFNLPFSSLELENLILRMTRMRSARGKDSPEMEAARRLGEGLFQAVFQGEVGKCLVKSQDKITPQTGLRIRLRLQDAPELSDLPWEFLFDEDEGRFLAQSAYTPIVRYLEFGGSIQPLKVNLPLRILAVIANPSDYRPGLDVKDEQQRLESALDELIRGELVKITWLQQATLDRLRRELRADAYHVFHFIGHGGFEQGSERGVLVFTDAYGRSQEVDAERLGVMLNDHRSLRLAVLNACQGGRVTKSDPFSGVATNLVRQGIPAVVAMQFEISDPSARAFAGEFYTALAQGYPVDAAQAEARKAIYCLPEDVEWGTPVLYLRSDDGVLFDLDVPAGKIPAAREAERATPASDVQPREAGSEISRKQPEATEAGGMDLPADLYAFEYLADSGVWISKYQVTNRQYQRFLDAADYAAQRFWVGFPRYGAPPKCDLQGDWGEDGWRWLLANFKGRTVENMRVEPRFWRNSKLGIQHPDLPVVGITWYEAYAYCQWLQEHWAECEEAQHNPSLPSFTLRLPLEAELEALSSYSGPELPGTLSGESEKVTDIASLLRRTKTGRTLLPHTTLAGWTDQETLASLALGGENALESLDLASLHWDWLATIDKQNSTDRVIYCPGQEVGQLLISPASQKKPPVHFSDTLGFHIVFYPGAVDAAGLQEARRAEDLQDTSARVEAAEPRQRQKREPTAQELPAASTAPEMVLPSDLYAFEYLPQSKVWIGKYPVMNAQYKRFLDAPDFAEQDFWTDFPRYGMSPASPLEGNWGTDGWKWLQGKVRYKKYSADGKHLEPKRWREPDFGIQRLDAPVIGINWYEASAYCKWLKAHWGECAESRQNPGFKQFRLRLPLETEWEEAAGGLNPQGRYAWDKNDKVTRNVNEIVQRANILESKIGCTTPVNQYPLGVSPLGVWDLTGNALEWQANIFGNQDAARTLRGGSFNDYGWYVFVAGRQGYLPDDREGISGFRLLCCPDQKYETVIDDLREEKPGKVIQSVKKPPTAKVRPVPAQTQINPVDPEKVLPSDLYAFVYLPECKGWIGKYPVTNIQYQRFLEAQDFASQDLWTGFPKYGEAPRCALIGDWCDEGWKWFKEALKDKQLSPDGKRLEPRAWYDAVFGLRRPAAPVVDVSWFEANAYCKWIRKHWSGVSEGKDNPDLVPNLIRLPTEAEWITAAGGAYPPKRFPWDRGQQVTKKVEDIVRCANVSESEIGCTTPVHMYPLGESPAGVWDMAGNVWEWQADIHPQFTSNLMLRGGSFMQPANEARLPSYGISVSPSRCLKNFSFRVFIIPTTT